MAAIQAELAAHPAALVVLAPLELAAAGASGSNLYDMGAVLQAIQGVCQAAGCALLMVTHWNKTGDGRGADRISGAGPAAWARVICSVAVHYRGSDQDGASAGWPRPGIRSSPAPSRPPSASWRRPGWLLGARKAAAGPATGHPPPQTRMPTAGATINRAMVGESIWHDHLAHVLIEPRRTAYGTTHAWMIDWTLAHNTNALV